MGAGRRVRGLAVLLASEAALGSKVRSHEWTLSFVRVGRLEVIVRDFNHLFGERNARNAILINVEATLAMVYNK